MQTFEEWWKNESGWVGFELCPEAEAAKAAWHAALTAANERIRELTETCVNHAQIENALSDQLTAEREVSAKALLALFAEQALSDKLEKALQRVVGDHHAPDDCYATGPITGNVYEDLIACPSCQAESLLAEIAHVRRSQQAAPKEEL